MVINNHFEIVPSTRNSHLKKNFSSDTSIERIGNALADNMSSIIELARDITDIQRMRVQSEAILKKMTEDRKMLLDEAEAYVQKKNADTQAMTKKIDAVRMLLKDFYVYNDIAKTSISGEQFSRIVHDVLMTAEDNK